MSNAQDHLDPKEATEAKLCAYLEGELAPEDRVDIENHLRANPQHRQLLTDLAETRDWMGTIPKESAPPELAEAFAAQMERSLLLDDHREAADSPMSRLPQYALLAAIVLVTLGLGALIAVMLKGGQNYTIAPPPKPGTGTVAAAKTPASLPAGDAFAAEGQKPAGGFVADKPIALPPAALASITHTDAAETPIARRIAVAAEVPSPVVENRLDRDELSKVQDAIRHRAFTSNHRTIALVVSTPDPAATADQVRRFFTSNQVAFDDRQPAGLDAKDTRLAKAIPSLADTLSRNGSFGTGGGQNPAAQNYAAQNSVPQNLGVQNLIAQRSLDQQAAGNSNAGAAAPQKAAPPTTAPAALPSTQDVASSPPELVYVGHGLTPLQLELLHGTLVTGGIDQTVRRFDLSRPSFEEKSITTPTVASDAPTIVKGQSLTVTVPQLVGPGIEKTNVVKVADDGTISLPMLDPVPATGTSPAELQSRIAAKYKEANLIPAATVTVAINTPSTQPATQPGVIAVLTPATLPAATQPIAAAKPATQPVADDRVDVVVYVEKAK